MKSSGYEFSLPSEAQWEYACRAGTTTTFSFGNKLNGMEANCAGNFHPYGTAQEGPYLGKTSPVGSYSENAWGLYDMHGNIWEWCRDRCKYDDEIVTDTYKDNIKNPLCRKGSARILRGGGWAHKAKTCRSAHRSCFTSDGHNYYHGFRLALVPIQ